MMIYNQKGVQYYHIMQTLLFYYDAKNRWLNFSSVAKNSLADYKVYYFQFRDQIVVFMRHSR